jgi:V/A-type H+-transporting ATPase subunit I
MIVKMRKVTFIGMESQKEKFLERLQEIGVAHLILPKEGVEAQDLAKELARVTETRKFLTSRAPVVAQNTKDAEKQQGSAEFSAVPVTAQASGGSPAAANVLKTSAVSHRATGSSGSPAWTGGALTASEICNRRETLAQREARLQTELVSLRKEIALQEPWGDFKVEDIQTLQAKGLRIGFFRVAEKVFASLSLENVCHEVINRNKGEVCFITLSFGAADLNIPEERIPSKSLSTLQEELVSKREELREIEREYVGLAAHLNTLLESESELTNLLAYRRATLNTETELDGRLFILKCWSPLPENELMDKIGPFFTLYHYAEDPTDDDVVPVAMINKAAFDSGEDLVKVYSHPSYKDFDPSGFVLYFFAVFFGMILGDAGYGAVLLAVTFFAQRKFRSSSPFAVRFFRLMYLLAASTIIYGIITAGYFGISISPENSLSRLMILDFNTKEGQNQIMILSILVGMIHISISLLIKFKNTRDFAALGWVPVIWGGYFLASSQMGKGVDNPPAKYVLILGLAVVFLFSSTKKNIILRVLEGLNGLLGIVQIFSDVLSYLRLFALGIATVYMAQTFNMLAEDIVKGVPWFGYIIAAIILIAGHLVNLLLGVMGGVIHGLRLNFLEWYRWCFVGDGLIYRPFRIIKSREQ